MAKSRSTKQEDESSKQQAESTPQPGQDLFHSGLERMLGRKISEEEAEMIDGILSGVDPDEDEEMEEEQELDEAEETQPSPSDEVLGLMKEYGVDRQTAEKWADMI